MKPKSKSSTIIVGQDYRDCLEYRWGSGDAIEITDIEVGSERRVGKGRALVEELLRIASSRTHLIFAITRSSNRIAREFYLGIGFREMSILHDFYVEEDAVMYGRRIDK